MSLFHLYSLYTPPNSMYSTGLPANSHPCERGEEWPGISEKSLNKGLAQLLLLPLLFCGVQFRPFKIWSFEDFKNLICCSCFISIFATLVLLCSHSSTSIIFVRVQNSWAVFLPTLWVFFYLSVGFFWFKQDIHYQNHKNIFTCFHFRYLPLHLF